MELALQILSGAVCFICLFGGMNLLLKGSGKLMSEAIPPQPRIDNVMRFLSGIYFGLGFLMAWVIAHMHDLRELMYFIGIVVVCSGLGRLFSRMKVGSPGTYYDTMMMVEIAIGLAIILIEYFRFN